MFVLALTVTACSGIRVKVETDCLWAVRAPELSEEDISGVLASDIEDGPLEALNRLDNFVDDHNVLYERYCE